MKPDEPWGTRPWPPHTDRRVNTMQARIVPHQLATGWIDLIAISIVRTWAIAASGMLGFARMIGGPEVSGEPGVFQPYRDSAT